jgi:glycosyltransferase involved in cell wall biosynthesis
MRPALEGHAGIPQEARLLFRGLGRLDNVEVEGLLQSSSRVLAEGLPSRDNTLDAHQRVNRLSQVVVSLQMHGQRSIGEKIKGRLGLAVAPLRVLLRTLLGLKQPLTVFDPQSFKDFVWRNLFSRTLPSADFEQVTSARFRIARMPWQALNVAGLITRRLGYALYPCLDTREFDIMVAETPYPGRVAKATKLVVRYHDAIPLLMPHTISNRAFHQATHYQALRRNVRDGAWFACVSDATRRDLVSVFPEAEPRAVTIPNMVSHHYHREPSTPARLPDILRLRRHSGESMLSGVTDMIRLRRPEFEAAGSAVVSRGNEAPPYLLMVSTIEPRKNHLTLLAAWEQLRAEGWVDLQLVLVGSLGWDHKAIVKRFRPWQSRGGLHLLEDVPSEELRLLYAHALVTVCPSFGEGFDYSGVEAMRCGGVVAASEIAVHRDVFGEAAEYFSPYASKELVAALRRIAGPGSEARRAELQRIGDEVSTRYLPEHVLPQWQEFLNQIGRQQ